MSDNNISSVEMSEHEDPKNLPQWFAVYCKSRHEKKVAEQLEEKGIDHYLPLRTEVRQWSDRKKKVEIPLFRGYIFVHIPKHLQVPVLETYGAVTFVKFAGKLVPIRDEQIEAVRRIEEYGADLQPESGDFELEDRVRVLEGSCKGLEGRLIHKKKGDRFVVVIDSLKLGASVVINKEWLEKIDEGAPAE
ncbi:MAG: UpxY family transcription antiterminator [Candidatus Marinimicrobia bacterium]|nr:UpxY family transcription antiterminator [Candidatus Neomarinimicrobiota bacterium]MCF7827453.1 UpxY family transcription antiterminator [Candidatus Neomarinimicrobiota bacterium]MCF7882328.1 UpxY family transcription antiterminator [Candidatus Neomarinimicrobiota bacterium]